MTVASPHVPALVALEPAHGSLAQARLEAISRFIVATGRAHTPERLFEAGVDCICSTLGVERSAVLTFDAQGAMRFRASRGLSAAYRAAVEGHSPWRPGSGEPQPVHIPDVAADASLGRLRDVVLGEGIRSLSFYPLMHEGELLGKFMVYRSAPHAADDAEVVAARCVAAAIGSVAGRQRAEAALRESEARHRDLVRNLPGVVYRLQAAPPWRALEVSDEVGNLTGWDAEAFTSGRLGWLDLVHPEDRGPVAQREAGPDRSFRLEYRIVRKDGAVVWVQDRARTAADAGGAPVWDGVVLDITERKGFEAGLHEANRRLRHLDELRNEFLNMVAHELRTPMTPIVMQLRFLRDALPPEQARRLAILDRNMERLNGIVQQLLEVARVQSRGVAMRPQPLDLATIAGEGFETFEPAARQAGVGLELALGPAPVVAGDAARLVQVVTNLLGNALKFTPAGGHITVRLGSDGGDAVLEVVDTGVGFPPEQAERLFEPFSQLHAGQHGGTGLGLFISRCIVEAHGGTVWARSAGPGQGASFGFRLPAKA